MPIRIRVNLERLMTQRKMSLTELAGRVGLTLANLSNIKTNKARAIRFSTLEALCRELVCQPGDLLEYGQSSEPAQPETAPLPSPPSNHGLPGDYY